MDYQIKETRLLEFTDIGMGMDRACLSSFIGHQSRVEASEDSPARSTREWMRKTAKDMPTLKSASAMSFLPLDEVNSKTEPGQAV